MFQEGDLPLNAKMPMPPLASMIGFTYLELIHGLANWLVKICVAESSLVDTGDVPLGRCPPATHMKLLLMV